jgi:hypothetical protein
LLRPIKYTDEVSPLMELVPANNNLNLDDIDPETKKAENELS